MTPRERQSSKFASSMGYAPKGLRPSVSMVVGLLIGTCTNPTLRVNGAGKFLIPGLIDRHLHLSDVQSLEEFTSYGCTTAMHMNCGNYTQCHINADQPGLASFTFASMSAVGYGSPHSKTQPRPNNTLIFPDTDVVRFAQDGFNNGSDYSKITAETNGPSLEQQIQMVNVARHQYNKRRILQQKQFVTPTLNVFEFAYRSKTLQKYFSVTPGSNRTIQHAETNAKLLYQHGVPLIAGTDSVGQLAVGDESTLVPCGLSLHFELQNFVSVLGMSRAEAINSATRDAAKWHRIADRGSIQVEKRADLVLLNKDPLADIANTLSIDRIWASGVPVALVAQTTNSSMTNPAFTPVKVE
ncbi:hypothetical protein FNYG_02330 [Fusarium nygamai]|uniref:Amidohydrolase-related domain-containing protein n=1 Tax=Gibberella nygamai TaxID=42673 RepID=A0A2K0WPV1_GIBNY|nr:hypothetical protein FNYG_02330 [Fusarium nygamai]